MNKIISVYKPVGVTSYDIIRKLKKKYSGKKIGHGGTLDPLAEGVLVIGIGNKATKQLSEILKDTRKEYSAVIELGKISATDDAEGPIKSTKIVHIPSTCRVQAVIKRFEKSTRQIPPIFSAVKIKGVPAYKRARRGEKVDLKPKQVFIESIELISYCYPVLKIKVVCGSGVYIRALARDIGKKLETGGYLKSLIRTRVGRYKIKDSVRA